MARIRYFDYQSPDTTLLLNEWRRGILLPGVYFGYNAVPGSGGLNISLTMDSDPDKSGASLGTIITRDAVTVQETADLIDVATAPAAHPTLPRIDILVATYVYNAGLPNNDVTYEVVQGTAASSPVAPTPSNDQLVLAQIFLDAAQVTLLADDIVDVNRRNLYDAGILDSIENILRPGFYTGFLCKTGGADNRTTVEAGTFLSNEYKRLVLSTNQVDLFTHSDTSGATFYRYDWIVAMHKAEDLESTPVDYILVEGSEANEATSAVASPPSDGDILTAAQAVDPKYTSNDFINKICLVRVQGTAGSMTKNYIHTPRLLIDTAWYVSGGSLSTNTQPLGPIVQYFPYQGPQGMETALNLLRTLVENFYAGTEPLLLETPIKLWVEGEFQLPPDELYGIPSYVQVCGIGGAVFRAPEETHPIFAFGLTADTNVGGTTINSTLATDQTGVPGGFERWELDLAGGTGSGAFAGLSDILIRVRFAGHANSGDPIYVDDNGTLREGWFEQYTTVDVVNADDTFRVILPTAMTGPVIKFVLFKQHAGIKDVSIVTKSPTGGSGNYLSLMGCRECVVDNIIAPSVEISANNEASVYRDIRVENGSCRWLTRDAANSPYPNLGGNRYDGIYIRPDLTNVQTQLGRNPGLSGTPERYAHVTNVILDYHDNAASTTVVQWDDSVVDSIEQLDGNASLAINGSANVFSRISVASPKGVGIANDVTVVGSYNMIGVVRIPNTSPATVIFGAAAVDNTLNNLIGTDPELTFSSTLARRNYLVGSKKVDDSGSTDSILGASLQVDEDRNIQITSEATFSWNGTTGTLTFDNDIFIDLPYTTGRMVVQQASSPLVIADSSRVFVHISREDTGDTAKTPLIVTKATSDTRRNRDELILARRVGTFLYFSNGAIFPDGVTGTLDNAVPLDGSVTHAKLADSAKAFVNDCLISHFGTNPNVPDDITTGQVLFAEGVLVGLGTFSINSSTGILSNVGLSPAEWSTAQEGDAFVDVDGRRWWIVQATSTAWRLKPGAAPNLTVSTTEHDITVVRGNGVWSSTDTYTISVVAGLTGRRGHRITMSSASIPDYVKVGHIFIDSSGGRFKINGIIANLGIIDLYSTTRPADYSGSGVQLRAVTDNNPRQLNFADLRPNFGMEVLPCWGAARRGSRVNEELKPRIHSDMADVYSSTSRYGPDPRILAFGLAGGGVFTSGSASVFESIEGISLGVNAGITVTAYMTGFALVAGNPFSTMPSIILDGVTVASGAAATPTPGFDEADDESRILYSFNQPELANLEPGVHTITLSVSSVFILNGIAIFNEPNPWKNGLMDEPYHQVPGRVYADMTSWDHALQDVTLPTLSRRGGKLIRYIPQSDPSTQAWAVENLEIRDDTGDTSNVSPTITNVGTPSQFKVGDLVRIVYSNAAEKRLITAVGASSIDVSPNPSTNQVGALIQWAGRTFTSIVVGPEHDFTHPNEKEIIWMPFYGLQESGGAVKETAWMGYDTAGVIEDRAVLLPDDMQYVVAEQVEFGPAQYWMELGAITRMRIGFIGTGLDITFTQATFSSAPTPAMNIPFDDCLIDGISLGSGTFNYLETTSDVFPEFSGSRTWYVVPICQDLDYGFHCVEIDFNVADADMAGYRVWGPKDPTFDGTPIWESYVMGDRARVGGGLFVDDSTGAGNQAVPSGFLSAWPGEHINTNDVDGGFTHQLFVNNADTDFSYERGKYSSATTNLGIGDVQTLYMTFYGSAFGLEVAAEFADMDLNVQVMDTDGQWRDITSLNRAAISGSLATIINVPTSPTRYFWEFFEPTGINAPLEQFWIIKLEVDNTGGTAGADFTWRSLYLKSKTHMWQREDMTGGSKSRWLVPRSQGRDRRVLRAYEVQSLQPPFSYHFNNNQHSDFRSFAIFKDQIRQHTLMILSEGEWWTVEVEIDLTEFPLDHGFDLIWENGLGDYKAGAAQANNATARAFRSRWTHDNDAGAAQPLAGSNQVALSLKVFLQPGFHLFTVNSVDVPTNDYTNGTSTSRQNHYSVRATPNVGGKHNLRPFEFTLPLIQNADDVL